MVSTYNAYDELYSNLQARFTATHDGREYTVGEWMLQRASKRNAAITSVETETSLATTGALRGVAAYISERLLCREPEKTSTIKRFPLRTSVSAIFSAIAACALIFSLGVFILFGNNVMISPYTANANSSNEQYEVESTLTDTVIDIENNGR